MVSGKLVDEHRAASGNPVVPVPTLPDLLKSGAGAGEQAVHESLCRHSEYLHFPVSTHHRHFFRWVITKYPLPSGNITDFVYITTTTASNTVALVEIEDPDKPLWIGSPHKPAKAVPFSRAIEQVEKWRSDLQRPEQLAFFLTEMRAMMGNSGLRGNSFELKYCLVYGRSADLDTEPRRDMFASLQRTLPFSLITFDNMVSARENGITELSNIVRVGKPGPTFTYTHLNREPHGEFAALGPDTLLLGDVEAEILKTRGYDIDAWKKGDRLVLNGKHPASAIPIPKAP